MQNAYELIAYGRTAELLDFAPDLVLKLFKSDMPLQPIENEFHISKRVYQAGVPSPESIRMIEMDGRHGIVYRKLSGVTMLKAISKDPRLLNQEAARMARLHANMHQHAVSDLPNQREILSGSIKQAPILTIPEKEWILNRLETLKEDTRLCHGDFHPDNILLGEREWIIDWMTGMIGNPTGDVARTIVLIKYGTMPDETPKAIVSLISQIRRDLLSTYLQEYIMISEMDPEEIDQWMIPVAAARLNEWIPDKEKQKLVEVIRKEMANGTNR
ncbi:phosphotransferase [Cohnella sp. CFH 77786]|uniref:aminoglycoside phosphotransferase family protein n=1 Tax=Cohnella sp. CFH 77786 TaxID=2662265 RepID=UPI001C60F7D7|nr:phosphotransferase [Cohnella sp. CFH 77786]MBW5448088.1 phosphotransferase [Cohnella sp. CFH 77786]